MTRLMEGLEATNVYTVALSLTPVALAASISTQEQAFSLPVGSFPGSFTLKATDLVLMSPPSQDTSLAPAVYARANAAGQIVIGFANLTAAATVPPAGTYVFVVIRP